MQEAEEEEEVKERKPRRKETDQDSRTTLMPLNAGYVEEKDTYQENADTKIRQAVQHVRKKVITPMLANSMRIKSWRGPIEIGRKTRGKLRMQLGKIMQQEKSQMMLKHLQMKVNPQE